MTKKTKIDENRKLPVKKIEHSWGEEIIIGSGPNTMRLYWKPLKNKLTIDMSQAKKATNPAIVAALRKHRPATKIEVNSDKKKLQVVIDFFSRVEY